MRYEDEYYDEELPRKRKKSSTAQTGRTGGTASKKKKRQSQSERGVEASRRSRREEERRQERATQRRRSREYDYEEEYASSRTGRADYDDYYELEERPSRRGAAATKRSRTVETSSRATGHGKKTAREKNPRNKRRRLVIILGVEAVLLVAAVVCVFLVSKYNLIQTPSWGKTEIQYNTEIAAEVLQSMEEDYTDIMIFGTDARITNGNTSNLDGGSGADVDILVHINNSTGEIQLISFYRDLYLYYDGSYRKLTDIYRAYGAQGALSAINQNLDLNIQQFVTVSWGGAAETIDLLGGVYVDIGSDMLTYVNAYTIETMNETGLSSTTLTSTGYQHLDGVQTVAYCRIRYVNVAGYSIGDYGRTERQREVLQMLLAQAKQKSILELNTILDTILPQVLTNVTLADAISLVSMAASYEITSTAGFPFNQASPTINGASVVVAIDLEDNVLQLHQLLYGTDDGYTVSATVQSRSDYMKTNYGY